VGQGSIISIWFIPNSLILLNIFQAPLNGSLSLLVVRLKFTNAEQVVACQLVSLEGLIGETSPQVGLDEDVCVVQIQSSINNLGCELNLLLVLGVLAETECDVVENTSFKLGNFLLEEWELVKGF